MLLLGFPKGKGPYEKNQKNGNPKLFTLDLKFKSYNNEI
jgi:hypothetical protein